MRIERGGKARGVPCPLDEQARVMEKEGGVVVNWKVFSLGYCAAVFALAALPAHGVILLPNDDAYAQSDDNSNPHDDLGLAVKGDPGRRTGYIEFDIPAEMTEGTLYLYGQAVAGNMEVKINWTVHEFDETVLTWLNRPSDALTWDGVAKPAQSKFTVSGDTFVWYSVPLDRVVANGGLGETVTFMVRCQSSDAPEDLSWFEDREGTLTGNTANGPYIDYVPEPNTMLLIGLATAPLLMARRKRG